MTAIPDPYAWPPLTAAAELAAAEAEVQRLEHDITSCLFHDCRNGRVGGPPIVRALVGADVWPHDDRRTA